MTATPFVPSTEMPPLHTAGYVTTGNLLDQKVLGFTITRDEFQSAVDATYSDLSNDEETDEQLRAIIDPVVAAIDRFPVGAWMTDRGCGCIVGEALVANEVIARHDWAAAPLTPVHLLLAAAYSHELASALEAFGNQVDSEVIEIVYDIVEGIGISFDRSIQVVFIQD